MPTIRLQMKGPVSLEKTPTLNAGGLSACNLMRFFGGLPEKIGGWAHLLGVDPIIGTCRALFGWASFAGAPYLAVGTEQRLQLLDGGMLEDITPLRATDNVAVNFSTVISTNVVTIVDATTAPDIGDWVNIVVPVSVGGLIILGYYQVQSIPGANAYTIWATTNATATVNNAGAVPVFGTTNLSSTVNYLLPNHGLALGDLFSVPVSTTVATVVIFGPYVVSALIDANNVSFVAGSIANNTITGAENGGLARIQYLLATGYAVNTPAGGWGAGDWGAGDWGGANAVVGDLKLRTWSLDHWGEDLIASPSGGGIYSWSPPTPSPAVIVPNAPTKNIVVFGVAQAQILVALGSELLTVQYPTLVRWSDSGDRTAWTATATNQAGSFQLPSGSTIVAGLAVGLGALIWTDTDLWSMAYQGLPYVFGFNRIAVNCEAISSKAPVAVGNSVVWPSDNGFFRYDGSGVAPLDCTVWSWMFDNLDTTQAEQVIGALNTLYDEVAWHFPIDASSPIYLADAPYGFIKWNYAENLWDYGQSSQYQRTGWVDHSPVGNPIGADLAGLLQMHEIGHDADGQPMVWFFRSGDFDLGESGEHMRCDRIDPDFHQHTPEPGQPAVQTLITILGHDFADDPYITYGPYTVNSTTPFLNLNLRNRQVAVEIGGNALGGHQRLGAIKARVARSGRR